MDNEDGDLEEDTVMMDALDAGASDFEADGDVFDHLPPSPTTSTTWPTALEAKGYDLASRPGGDGAPELRHTAPTTGTSRTCRSSSTALEDNDDVQNVCHNWEQE